WLRQQGITTIILDVDNTLLPWDADLPVAANIGWLQQVKTAGFKIILVSNNGGQRLQIISKSLEVPCVGWAIKPFGFGFKRALKYLAQQNRQQVLVIGDQIMTDVLGANKMGFKVLWVESLSRKEFVATRLTRRVEALLINVMLKKGIMPEVSFDENSLGTNEHTRKK
ncbi:MAG: YqeG family HAD IIIA-type phosphatase, partial [Acidaminococcaceae bacterium]